MRYLRRFISDLLYGYPALSNLWWGIKEDMREKNGYYTMKKIPMDNITKWADITTHKRRIIDTKDLRILMRAVRGYNEVISRL